MVKFWILKLDLDPRSNLGSTAFVPDIDEGRWQFDYGGEDHDEIEDSEPPDHRVRIVKVDMLQVALKFMTSENF